MNKVFGPCLLLSLTAVATGALLPAQAAKIRWHDGKEERIVLIDYDAKQITYKNKTGSKESAPSHAVQQLTVKDWLNDIDARCPAPENFLTEADTYLKADKKLLAAYCLKRAAEEFLEAGNVKDMLVVLQNELDAKLPNSPWTPMNYQMRFRYYMGAFGGKPSPKDALAIAEKYLNESVSRGWARGYEIEAKFFIVVHAIQGGNLKKADCVTRLDQVLADAEANNVDFVYNNAMAFKGDFQRAQKDYDKAAEDYGKLIQRQGLEPEVLARSYLGLGYVQMEKGVASKDKEAFHQAYLSFLKVYVLTAQEASAETVAEALYRAAQAAESWGGLPTSKAEAARLRGRLRLRKPWRDTSWAKK